MTRPARPSERCAITPVQNAMFRSGQLDRPTMCSICLFSDPARINGSGYIFAHLERYDRPGELFPSCKRCHAALHARFREPDRWHVVLQRHWAKNAWFTFLSLDAATQWQPFDLTYPNGLLPPYVSA